MKIITVTGYKGGIGKSTTAVHVATYFSNLGKTVLVDGDPNRTAINWGERGSFPFLLADERRAMKMISGADFIIIDTPARPHSDDLQEQHIKYNIGGGSLKKTVPVIFYVILH